MIDEELDAEFEELLKATLAEMIPKAQGAARAAVGHVSDAHAHEGRITSDLADVRPPAGRRVWVGVAAAAITVMAVGGLAVIAGRDTSTPAASSPGAEPVGTTPIASPDAPAWYPLLRDALPDRFPHVALTNVNERQAEFVAISPGDGKSLDIFIETGGFSNEPATDVDATGEWVQVPQGWTVRTPDGVFITVRCDIGARGREDAWSPNYCDMESTGAFTAADIRSVATRLAQSIHADSVGPALGASAVATLDPAPVTDMILGLDPAQALVGDTAWGPGSRILDYSTADINPDISIQLVNGVYPLAANAASGFGRYALYDDAAAFWRFSSDGRAIRVTTTDTSVETLDVLDVIATAIVGPPAGEIASDLTSTEPTTTTSESLEVIAPRSVVCVDAGASEHAMALCREELGGGDAVWPTQSPESFVMPVDPTNPTHTAAAERLALALDIPLRALDPGYLPPPSSTSPSDITVYLVIGTDDGPYA